MMEPPVKPISFKRHRFPADVIRQAVWLYFRFTLSFRDVEELLAQRGIEVSYGCCQSNGNSSPVWRNSPNPSLALAHDRAPLSQGGRASLTVEVSADEVAFLVEVIVDHAVYGSEFLKGLHPAKSLHGPFSSPEGKV
jgi:hypothetical protein